LVKLAGEPDQMGVFEVEIFDKIVDTIADLVNTSFSVGG